MRGSLRRGDTRPIEYGKCADYGIRRGADSCFTGDAASVLLQDSLLYWKSNWPESYGRAVDELNWWTYNGRC